MINNPWEKWLRVHTPSEPISAKEQRLPVEKRPMLDEEKSLIASLQGCTFYPGSWNKRFVHALNCANEITERQSYWLYKVAYHYRKQLHLPNDIAEELAKIASEKLNQEG